MSDELTNIVFDNGSDQSIVMKLPSDNELEVSPRDFVVVETGKGRLEFHVRQPDADGFEKSERIVVHLDGDRSCYVYNHKGSMTTSLNERSMLSPAVRSLEDKMLTTRSTVKSGFE